MRERVDEEKEGQRDLKYTHKKCVRYFY